MPESSIPLLASYGRRRGRKLRPKRQELIEELLPKLALREEEMRRWGGEENFISLAFPHIPTSPYLHIFLEIGFGSGEHLAHQAQLHPEAGIIGCEPYINGVAGLLARLCLLPSGEGGAKRRVRALPLETPLPASPATSAGSTPSPEGRGKISNIRIFQGDARLLIEKLPHNCLDKVFILYPDPWPKARHHKRRLVSTEFLDALARVMKPGAELRLATDDEDYLIWMLERLLSHCSFEWTAKTCDDWQKPWPDWISTRYEQKALKAGRQPTYLTFERI